MSANQNLLYWLVLSLLVASVSVGGDASSSSLLIRQLVSLLYPLPYLTSCSCQLASVWEGGLFCTNQSAVSDVSMPLTSLSVNTEGVVAKSI